ncbi:MAG: sugar phosphate isomerase/epimerase family protein [Phycisphaeraceae bacterium]
MSNITDRLGVQSFCFRGFKDNAKVAQMVRELDLDRIEVCAVHADFSDLAGWKNIVKTYNDAGVQIVSIGVQTFTGDPKERDWFECAKAAGAKYISAHFNVDSFQTAVPATAKLCEEYGIQIAIHCHGGYRFGGSPDVVGHLMELGGPNIGLCLDTAWCMQIGPRQGDPLAWVDQFSDRLYGVHVKDFTFDRNAQWNDVVVGTGNLDLPAFMQALEKKNFAGYIVLEYEADVNDPVPALKQCVQQVRQVHAQ